MYYSCDLMYSWNVSFLVLVTAVFISSSWPDILQPPLNRLCRLMDGTSTGSVQSVHSISCFVSRSEDPKKDFFHHHPRQISQRNRLESNRLTRLDSTNKAKADNVCYASVLYSYAAWRLVQPRVTCWWMPYVTMRNTVLYVMRTHVERSGAQEQEFF